MRKGPRDSTSGTTLAKSASAHSKTPVHRTMKTLQHRRPAPLTIGPEGRVQTLRQTAKIHRMEPHPRAGNTPRHPGQSPHSLFLQHTRLRRVESHQHHPRMKTHHLLRSLLAGACLSTLAAHSTQAEEKALLAIPGKLIYENALSSGLSDPWKAAKGAWDGASGSLRGSEKPEDKHGAVARMPNKLGDFVLEYEFKFEGAKSTSLSINAAKGHLARILITPQFVTIQKDDSDHEGPDKAVVFARFPSDLKPGTWHKVRMEMVGDTMLGKVDDLVAWGSHDSFKQERTSPGLTVAGQSVDFRNLKLTEAALNPAWESLRPTLPAPGSQVAAPAAQGTAGKGKPKAD